jgi:hypothetical protein
MVSMQYVSYRIFCDFKKKLKKIKKNACLLKICLYLWHIKITTKNETL